MLTYRHVYISLSSHSGELGWSWDSVPRSTGHKKRRTKRAKIKAKAMGLRVKGRQARPVDFICTNNGTE